ncbi:acylphosphatase [Salisediminibacterium halotolerans]|uniref:ATP-binding protein n=1 Tax=Salisediminibacterium halotolerans TaxID=517425 RepID=UPI000F198216|nr:acylphosphatase [Salisediminibacterium halotolerans]RLJ75598.1 D-alanine-D-alanine ligase-like ATP-grasp enzyme [Actinophytocola xinjiangensis]RPE89452.1 D-alanine-D-alanine ligase-like ATP-grasp enzyme [Salisediminibacterium halotolerans]TWG36211.1 D-alanine-D-alanine ligase-like ATP-grasp enzyme [Salisediminibacterium halotolerans]GEL08350.1 hypothetical protein SHA02_17660 [Salisediminibacterium halotolerans]
MKNDAITLPQLTNEMVVNARKTRLCAFSVALEGWRRGLNLTWYTADSEHFQDMVIFGVNPPGRLYSLSNGERTHYFFRTRGDKVSNEAVEIGSEKDLTKEYLRKKNVAVPDGVGFTAEDSDEAIVQEANALGYPLVIKPTNGSLGNGVLTNIKDEKQLRKAIQYVRYKLEYPEVVIEQHVKGEEYRFYVIEDQVIAVYNRVPANIEGDGEHTIDELIRLKNIERKKNARLHSCLIESDEEIFDFLNDAGYSFDDVPPKGEQIYLREKTNVSSGGDPIDVTDEMDDYYKQIAIDAIQAVEGLHHGGVDIIVDQSKPKEKSAAVIELNPTAQIGGILYPLRGKARDIPKAIIDYYFPETKGIDTSKSKIYFDLPTVMEPLENRSSLEIEVNPAPKGELFARKLTLEGDVNRPSFMHAISLYAQRNRIHGEMTNNYDGHLELIVAAESQEQIGELKKFMYSLTKKAKIKKIHDDQWKEPVKIGFEINEDYNARKRGSVNQALKRINREHKKLRKEIERLKKDNLRIQTSTSWKASRFLRKEG